MAVVEIKLNQEEANLILRALEGLEESCAAAVETEHCAALQKLWGRIFDAGLEAGFGKEKEELPLTQQIDVFDVTPEDDDEELSYCAPV